jgi:hypothetical protein
MGLRFSKNGIATFRAVNYGYDPDAQLFITATGISGNDANATNQLVIDLKNANIWTKMKAAYPMVGGTATSHKFNLKNPLDTNAAFRLNFIGGGTHSSNGYLPNGINAYANTFLNPLAALTNNNTHMSYYSRTIGSGNNQGLIGASTGGLSLPLFTIYGKNLTNNFFMDGYDYNVCRLSNNEPTGAAFYINSRISSISLKAYRNAALLQTITNTNTFNVATINFPITIGALNLNGVISQFSFFQCAFASIGDGLTDAEALAFYTAVQTFNTTLGRQV